MDSSLGQGSYVEYRAQLLQRALEEKKKLGLDGIQANVRHSSALQALRCYGLESSDSASFGEPEIVSSSHTNERRKTIDLQPKQSRVASPHREKYSLSSDSFSSGDKTDRPLKSILKRTENSPDSPITNRQDSPYGSGINTPFFLNNAENEDEFLYGKSINEQSLRVSALHAESKSKSNVINLNVQNMKTSVNPSANSKTTVTNLGLQGPKASSCSDSKKKSIDLFAQDSKTSTGNSSNNKSKSSVADINARNPKVSSSLSGYAALLSFSRSGTKNVEPKTNSVSLQKGETSREKKTSRPATDNPASTNLCSPNKKLPVTKCVGEKSNPAPSSNANATCKSKPVARLLPRSIQKLQTKRLDQSANRKDTSSESTVQKASGKVMPCDTAENGLPKSSEKAKKSYVKPARVDDSLKNDEMLLLKYVQGAVRSSGEKTRSGVITQPMTDNIKNYDSKSNVKKSVQKMGSSSGDTYKSGPDTPMTSSIINSYSKPVVNTPSAVQTAESSSEAIIKSGPVTGSMPGSVKKYANLKPLVDTVASPKGMAGMEARKRKFNSLNKKEFLSKLSSIKQNKRNFPFHYRGKRPVSKEFLPKKPSKRPRSSFDHEKGYGHTAKGKEFSGEKHTFDFGPEKMMYVGREIKNKGTHKKSSFGLGPEISTSGSDYHSYDFIHEKNVAGNSRFHGIERTSALQKPDEMQISSFDERFSGGSAKRFGKYNYINPDRFPADKTSVRFTKKGRNRGQSRDLSPKPETFYGGHGRDSFKKNLDRYSVENSPERHSLDWSPSRNEFHNSPRRHSLDHSPERYSYDASPKSPVRHSFNEGRGSRPFDRSPSTHSFSRSPGPYSYDQSPDPHPYDRSPDPHPYGRSPDSHTYDRRPESDPYNRSPDPHSYDRSPSPYNRSPVPLLYDRSPSTHSYSRSPSRHHYDRSPDLHPFDRSPRLGSYDRSPEPDSHDVDSGSHLRKMSPRRHNFDGRRRLHSFDNSPERLCVDTSPRRLLEERGSGRLSLDRSPSRLSIDRIPRRLSIDRSPRRLSMDRSLSIDKSPRRLSNDRFSAERSPRRVPFDRKSKNSSFDRSPGRHRKSRLDCYNDRMSSRSPRKASHESLKRHLRSRSPEALMYDSSDRLSERSMKSNRSDLSQNLNTQAHLGHQQMAVMSTSHAEEYGTQPLEKEILSSEGISQQQSLQNILGTDLVIPNVNKIVNAIDTLASNFKKCAANEKAYGGSFQSFDSSLPVPRNQDPAQLPIPSATFPSAYEQNCYNQTSNNSQFGFSNEIPQASYPSYNISSADLYSSQYPTFQPQPSDSTSLYQTASSTFQSSNAAPPSYSNISGVPPPFSSASLQPPFCSTTAQTPFSGTSVVSSTSSGANTIPAFNTTGVMHPSFSAAGGLSEVYPAAQPSYMANNSSLERVSSLTAVPLQSGVSSEMNKSQSSSSSAVTMKFITPDKIEKLLRQKSDIRKQMAGLNREFVKLQKMQGDAMRRKRREKDGHKDILLLEYGRLQDEIKSHLSNLLDDIKDIEQELKNGFLGCTSEKEPKRGCPASEGDNEKGSEKFGECVEGSSNYYEFYDSGSHWCKHCNKLCSTMSSMLEHLKSNEHLQFTSLIDKPWASKSASDKAIQNEPKGNKITKPVKGVQFIMPVDGFYCSLCKEYFQKPSHIQEHLKSSGHYDTYQNFTTANPSYERQWLLDRLAGLAVIEIEESKRFAEKEKHLQKDKEEKLLNCKKEEEKVRQKDVEEDKKFSQEKDSERLRQKEEQVMNVKEKLKRKEHEVKRLAEKEEHAKEDEENLKRRMEVVEKLNRRKDERENLKRIIDQREEMRHREEVEKKWRMSCRKQEAEKLKRQRDEEKEASNKKLKIMNATEEEEATQNTGEQGSTEVVNEQPVEKLSKAEPKRAAFDGQKKLLSGKGNDSKSKPKQTVVYIGRAPNFKSYNKGNSSFRANLLKLALQKKEAESNSDKVNEVTSAESRINADANVSSPVLIIPDSSEQGIFTQGNGSTGSAGNVIDTSSTTSGLCATDKQVVLSESLAKNETNRNFELQNSFAIISNPQGSSCTSSANNCPQTLPTDKENTSESSNPEVFSGAHTDFSQNQESVPVSSCAPAVTNLTNNPRNRKLSVPVGSEKSLQQRKAKGQVPVHRPLTEEDEDFLLLGISKEDRLPLALPKPPPAALIRPCHKDDKNESAKEACNDEIAPVTSQSDTSKVQQSHSDVSSSQNHDANAAQTGSNPSDESTSHQNYGFTYDNVDYSHNVQANFAGPYEPVNCTNTSSVQYSHTYPYSTNVGNVTNFQGNFMPSEQPGNNMMGPYPAAQVSPPGQFQNRPPRVGYTYQGAPSLECYNQNARNYYYGWYPQNRFPPPNVNPHQNYCAPRFQGRFGQNARMPGPAFKKKRQNKEKKLQTKPNVFGKVFTKNTEMPVAAEKKMPSPEKAEKQPADAASEKQASPETVGVEGRVGNTLSEKASEGDIALTASTSENEKSSSSADGNAVVNLDDMEISEIVESSQKSVSVGLEGDMSNCAKLEIDCIVTEQNKILIQNVSTVGDENVASGHVSVQGAGAFSPVAEPNGSQQPSSSNAPIVATNGTEVKVEQGVAEKCAALVMMECWNSQTCESTNHVSSASDAISIRTNEDTSQQGNHPSEQKFGENAEILEDEMHAVSSSVKSQENICYTSQQGNHPSEQKYGEDAEIVEDEKHAVSSSVKSQENICYTSQQGNHPSEQKCGEDTEILEDEKHAVSSSVKSQENICYTEGRHLVVNAGNESSDTDEYDAGN